MSQIGKASSKRGKPSYVMSIIGVTLVLFLLGIVGWMIINTNKLSEYFKENVEVKVYLANKVSPKDSAALLQFIASRPYVRSYEYVNKDVAKKKYLQDGNEDFSTILDYNPLPDGIYFKPKNEYVQSDSLEKISKEIKEGQSTGLVSDVSYPKELVSNMNQNFRNISLIILGIAIILSIVVIFLIDNTIRLAMFSNRFLIKTMQMVGATRQFIARPLTIRAIVNGAISAGIAIVLIYVLILVAENFIPWLSGVRSSSTLFLLFLALMIIGITITFLSTWRSVSKYLRMKLDELY
ncbi:cell division protein FtsX [Flavisolibacter nicotianae]|uniref:cell division protein FtsX n=1 Tax=Flavisolibacter nicotianae TaxID=2364882 RepID=UPI0013C460E9|nr:permease-like cell division protein FtsX [Flavisolibacter nicotianae]